MSDIAISVRNVSKQYHIGAAQPEYRTFRDTLADAVAGPFRRAKQLFTGQTDSASGLSETIWALKDISFDVKKGEVVGIIGRNGAGKSTLLKILSRITTPTTGEVRYKGRLGSLLEVGTGFHQELTGRENIYLNGAILGMTRAEINRKFDEIVDFSGVEKFLDTPVKHYSSGMHVRLAFAVAAHLEPEILVVDEVLAVGDAEFQKKSMGKMSEVAGEGRTVLFVSHNMGAVQNLCSQTVRLSEGQVVAAGETRQVVKDYLNNSVSGSTDQIFDDIETAPGNDRIRVKRSRVVTIAGTAYEPITMMTPIRLEFEYWNLMPNTYLNLSLHVFTADGTMAFNTAPVHDVERLTTPFYQGLFRSVCYIPGHLLNSGTYRVNALFVEDQARVIYLMEDAIVFDVAEAAEARGAMAWYGRWPGVVHPKLDWETTELELEIDKYKAASRA